MADNTLIGIISIVLVTLIAAVFIAGTSPAAPTGAAHTFPENTHGCNPGRFCDGSKLVIIQDDCSLNQAYCRYGCDPAFAACR